MKGGHSGIDIALEKANAIKVLGRVMNEIAVNMDLRLAHLQGGSAHNAIPRDSEAVVLFPEAAWEQAKDIVAGMVQTLKAEFVNTDPDLHVDLEQYVGGDVDQAATTAETIKAVDFIAAMPHGVDAMSTDIAGLVETSNNFANIKIEDNTIKVLTSQRSSVVSRLKALTNRIEAVAKIAGGDAVSGDGYPPWQPNMESLLLARAKEVYKKQFGKDPVVEVIHAGLECGIIGDKNPGMDMLSIGPTLKYPHSPDEKIHVGTIGMVWDFICQLMLELK